MHSQRWTWWQEDNEQDHVWQLSSLCGTGLQGSIFTALFINKIPTYREGWRFKKALKKMRRDFLYGTMGICVSSSIFQLEHYITYYTCSRENVNYKILMFKIIWQKFASILWCWVLNIFEEKHYRSKHATLSQLRATSHLCSVGIH